MLKSFTRANQQETQDVSFHVWGLIKFPGPSNLWHILETFFFSFFSPSFFTSTVVLCGKYKLKSLELLSSREFKLERWKSKKKKKSGMRKEKRRSTFSIFFLFFTRENFFFYFFPLSFCLAFSSLQTAFVILTCPIMPLDFDKIFVYVYLTSSK